jgi:hypothetical protein
MQIRVFDCWMHEQDIRVTVEQPGHRSGLAVEVTLDEMSTAMGYVVGKRAAAPPGSAVTLELMGDSGRSIHVEVGERARVVASLDRAASTVLSMPVVTFSRLAGGRLDAAAHVGLVSIEGDQELGRRVLENLAYTI